MTPYIPTAPHSLINNPNDASSYELYKRIYRELSPDGREALNVLYARLVRAVDAFDLQSEAMEVGR